MREPEKHRVVVFFHLALDRSIDRSVVHVASQYRYAQSSCIKLGRMPRAVQLQVYYCAILDSTRAALVLLNTPVHNNIYILRIYVLLCLSDVVHCVWFNLLIACLIVCLFRLMSPAGRLVTAQ